MDVTSTKEVMVSLKWSPAAVPRSRAVCSKYTYFASSTAKKQFSQSANIFRLYSFTQTSFQCTWVIPNHSPNEIIPAASGTADIKCPMDCSLAPVAREFL